MASDLARERALVADAAGVLESLDAEADDLRAAAAAEGALESEARSRLAAADAALAAAETELAAAQDTRARVEARRATCASALRDERAKRTRIEAELASVAGEREALLARRDGGADPVLLRAALEAALETAAAFEDEIGDLEAAHAGARSVEAASRGKLTEAERRAQKLGTEAQTLSKLLTAAGGGFWPPVTDEITVAKGFEAALGAALGDDLDASTNESAPAHWAETDRRGDPPLPPGVEPLADLVTAPVALARRLNQIGLVARVEGRSLSRLLKPGQRLVSKEGDLWRWDGFNQAAEAPTPAARRLAEKNRLGDLIVEAEAARAAADSLITEADSAQDNVTKCAAAESEARRAHKAALREVESAREDHSAAERAEAAAAARLSALDEALQRLTGARDEASAKAAEAQAGLDDLADPAEMVEQLEICSARAGRERAIAGEARAELQAHVREAQARAKRLEAIAGERASWLRRSEGSGGQIGAFEARIAEATAEHETLADAPDAFLASRRTLIDQIEAAEAARKEAADRRAAAETALAAADRAARAALDAMSAAREQKARAETRIEAARARRDDVLRLIGAELDCAPAALPALAQIRPDDPMPPAADIERRLEGLKQDRERLGAVNLRAEEELNEAEAAKASLAAEHADLTAAIQRLRQAIQSLNKEGRERLLAAFEKVNAHFTELFTTLFGGGSAELQLVESDDPLEAGLEIIARPPGKKPQVMTLLSGGEQALTALSLIFAIFLTNPAPICVLDEVDAPLDDANVERFCDLLDDMRRKTETRFITITHNPITMARMNRLFGVTMAERGVSQLVSVDLEDAERLLDAG
jgi:chromosome segregation protein